MSSRLIIALIIMLLAPGVQAQFRHWQNGYPVYIQEGGELLLNSDDEIHYQKWEQHTIGGKSPHYPVYRRA